MKTALGLLAGMILASSAFGQSYRTTHLGDFDFTTGPNGYYGVGTHLGDFYQYRDNYGSGFGYSLGKQSYFNYHRRPWDEESD